MSAGRVDFGSLLRPPGMNMKCLPGRVLGRCGVLQRLHLEGSFGSAPFGFLIHSSQCETLFFGLCLGPKEPCDLLLDVGQDPLYLYNVLMAGYTRLGCSRWNRGLSVKQHETTCLWHSCYVSIGAFYSGWVALRTPSRY